MKIIYLFLLLVIFYCLKQVVYAQESSGGIPMTLVKPWQYDSLVEEAHNIILPALDNERLTEQADSISNEKCDGCGNRYFGKGLDMELNLKTEVMPMNMTDGGKLWLLRLQSATAYGMMFYFDKFHLPPGATLFIYRSDRKRVLGAFTEYNHPADESQPIPFGVEYIPGNDIIMEYYEPYDVTFPGELSIAKVVHGFRDGFLESGPHGTSLPCNINVVCPEGVGWQNEINSVALILGLNSENGLSSWCSGALINNTSRDGKPYFLTANHCIDDYRHPGHPIYNQSTWTFLFHHQSMYCESNGSDVLHLEGKSIYGATLLSADLFKSPFSDYALLELGTNSYTLANYGVSYAGWSRTENPQLPFVGIHHPRGDIKKISKSYISIKKSENELSDSPLNQSGTFPLWEIDWDLGTTQKGSSGSPLFDQSHKIIGHLYYGEKSKFVDDCHPEKKSYYGKFSTSWEKGGFSKWLDPAMTGKQELGHYIPNNVPGGGNYPGSFTGPCPKDPHIHKRGFAINGRTEKVVDVCDEGPIVLKALHRKPSCNYTPFIPNKIRVQKQFTNCDKLQHLNPYRCDQSMFRCECFIAQLYISVVGCNSQLEPTGPENGKWMTFTAPDVDNHVISRFDLKKYLPEPYIQFKPGQYYKVKIATVGHSGWSEYTRYIHLYKENRTVDNMEITEPIHAGDLTLNHVFMDASTEVIASRSIEIHPNSELIKGELLINPDLNCVSFAGSPRLPAPGRWEENNEDNIPILPADKQEPAADHIRIFPNPFEDEVQIQLDYAENQIISILNVHGNILFSQPVSDAVTILNLNWLSSGLYVLQIYDQKGSMRSTKIVKK